MKLLLIVVGLLFSFFCQQTAFAQESIETLTSLAKTGKKESQRELGVLYFEKKDATNQDKQQALFWLNKAAIQGDPVAQNYLGYAYSHGIGVESHAGTAIDWYEKAAVQGDTSAQYALGIIYTQTQTYVLSNYWLTQAALRGNPRAQIELGMRYRDGTGMQHADSTQMFHWFKKAALADFGSAQFFIGDLYEKGDGIPQNSLAAAAWLTIAAEKEDEPGIITSRQRDVINLLSSVQKKQLKTLVTQYKQAISQNNSQLNARLSMLIPVSDPSPGKDFQLTKEKVQQDDIPSMVKLGLIYGNAIGVPRDYPSAVELFKKAAEKGNAEAQYYLAYGYLKGVGVEKDVNQAEDYFTKAAMGGEKFSRNYVGTRYRDGQGVEQNTALAMHYFQLSAMQGVANAQKNLAEMYQEGIGTKPDRQTAYVWYSLASAFGSSSVRGERDKLAAEITPDELNHAQIRAQKLFDEIAVFPRDLLLSAAE